jgi:hypothetical protein
MCVGRAALLNTAVEPLAMCYPGFWLRRIEGQTPLRLDSEHFRSVPRTCGPDYGRLKLRKTGHGPVGRSDSASGESPCSTRNGVSSSRCSAARRRGRSRRVRSRQRRCLGWASFPSVSAEKDALARLCLPRSTSDNGCFGVLNRFCSLRCCVPAGPPAKC